MSSPLPPSSIDSELTSVEVMRPLGAACPSFSSSLLSSSSSSIHSASRLAAPGSSDQPFSLASLCSQPARCLGQ
ncbi:MAG: hypothetical protein J6Z30_07740 [Pyramidobacter sp.]|nr:hypothetical protein [Pyramidobacter sp.]